MNYILEPFNHSFYNFVYELKKLCYKDYVVENFGSWNDDEQYKFFDNYIDKCSKNIQIIIVNNEPVGFFEGSILDFSTYEIGNICILPEFQGKGIGSSILKNIINENKDKNISLRVFIQNPAKKTL